MKKTLFIIFSVIIASAISGCGSNGIVSEENTAVTEVSNTENINDPVATNDIVHADGPTTGTLNGHEWVDLGLPSGTKWATCNIGATKSEEFGDYFAWGETKPKELYDWTTYSYCNGSWNSLTKYSIEDGYHGDDPVSDFIDDLEILEGSDDAATVNWGKGWRMPTLEEISELAVWQKYGGSCSTTCLSLNGVNGRLFTGPNGNSIFIPAAGYIERDTLHDVGSQCCCWSKELYENRHTRAWSLDFKFYSEECGYGWWPRLFGFTIRPVCN